MGARSAIDTILIVTEHLAERLNESRRTRERDRAGPARAGAGDPVLIEVALREKSRNQLLRFGVDRRR